MPLPSAGSTEQKPSSLPSPSDFRQGEWLSPGRAALLLGLLVFATFPQVILGLQSFVYRDYGVLGYPFVYHFRENFRAGEFPLWNPLSNCGAPFMAQWGTMTLYPFSLFFLLLPLPWSLGIFSLGHMLLGGIGMQRLAQRWTGNQFAAAVAGCCFVFNGVSLSSLIWPNYMVALGWMPWVVNAVESAWTRGGRRIIWGALLSALQLLAGVPELVLLTWLLLAGLWARQCWREKGQRHLLLTRMALVIVLSAGLFAVQLLPFTELLSHSHRDRSFASSKWPMPGWGWANLLVPLFHCFETPQGPFFQHGQQFMSSYYLGAGVFLLALWSMWRVREGRVWILGGATLFAFIMALGDNAFIYTFFKQIVPLASVARYPVKFVTLATFAIPLLAAFGIAYLAAQPREESKRSGKGLMIVGAIALGLIGLILWFAHAHPFPYDQWGATWKSGLSRAAFLTAILGGVVAIRFAPHRSWFVGGQIALLLLLYLDIRTHTANQNPTLPVEVLAPGLWEKNQELAPPRFGVDRSYITMAAEKRLLNSGVPELRTDFIGKRLALWSNLNLLEQIPKINGSSTLQIREQMAVHKLIYDTTNAEPVGLVDFLGASLRSHPDNPIEWVPRPQFAPLVTAGQRPVFAEPAEILRALQDPAFDGRAVVYLEQLGTTVVRARTNVVVKTTVLKSSARLIEVQTDAPQESVLVVAQSHYPCWQASIGGQDVTLLRANHAFQAVAIPAGVHTVRLEYRDRRFELGALISAVTLLACGIGLCFRRRKSKLPG